ncbi:MAG: heparinase II/III-family protein [bacterium]|nr:heparinase II/III-family protein [bacterium]
MLQKRAEESPAAKAALARIQHVADGALQAPPRFAHLAVPLGTARKNNRVNAETSRAAYYLTIAFCLTQDGRYRTQALAYFRAAREFFPPEPTTTGIELTNKYHVLYARDWLPYWAYTYDLLHDTLTPADQLALAQWLRGMVQMLTWPSMWQRTRTTSHGAWHAAAIGIVGAAIQDPQLLNLAEQRIRWQLDQQCGRDGMWKGASLKSHFAALRAYLAYAECTLQRRDNAYTWRNLRGEYYLRLLCDAPLMLVDPQGLIPGDGRTASEPPPGDIYLVAAARYNDSLYAAYAQRNMVRVPDEAVVWFAGMCAPAARCEPRPAYSAVSPSAGLGVLRAANPNTGQELYARLFFGPVVGKGAPANKLALYLSATGRRVSGGDIPVASSSPLRLGWLPHTIAHNTVVLNYRSQAGIRPSSAAATPGTLLLFDRTPSVSVIEADARNAYPHLPLAAYRRCVVLADRYCVDVFTVKATRPLTADWVWHGSSPRVRIQRATRGERSLNNEMLDTSLLGSASDGYQWIDDVTTYTAHEQWLAEWDTGLRTIMMGHPGTQILIGRSGGTGRVVGELVKDREYTESTLIARRANVVETRFAALHEIVSGDPAVESFVRLDTGTDALVLEIMTREWKDIIVIQPRRAKQEMLIDEHHQLTTDPRRFGFARLSRDSSNIVEQLNVTVKRLD